MSDDTLIASLYDNAWLDSLSTSNAKLYMRDATAKYNGTIADAINLGTLTTDSTQLDSFGQISRMSSDHFYKFTLDGDNFKLSYLNTTNSVSTRLQILDSSGTIIADSSTMATQELQDAYASVIESDGLDVEAGDYYVKITYEATVSRSDPQAYVLSLYSGTQFTTAYQTTTFSQVSEDQNLPVDDTMVFSASDALQYGVDNVHLANETAATGINIGWLYENKSALAVTGQITNTVDEEYYSFTFQKGDALKMSFDNHTDTAELRVQLLNSTGTAIIADSEGTDAQQEAYAALLSSDGLEVNTGQYIIKVSYKAGENKTKDQIYDFKLYSGTCYDKYYETQATTETMETAILSGHFTGEYNPATSLAAYLMAEANEEPIDIFEKLKELAGLSSMTI